MTIYAAYLQVSADHSNAAPSHPGFGESRDDALADSQYWANQAPWVTVRPLSRAPRWVNDCYDEGNQLETMVGCCVCGATSPEGVSIERREAAYWRCDDCRAAQVQP